MTTNEKANLERLTTSLHKCRIHLQRLHYAVSQTENLFPLKKEIFQNLDKLNHLFNQLPVLRNILVTLERVVKH